MQYTYLTLFSLNEGFSIPPQETQDFEYCIINNQTIEAILTTLVDKHCFEIDRHNALSESLLNGLFGGAEINIFNEKMDERIGQLQTERRQVIGNHVSLIVRFSEQIEIELPERKAERNDVIVCFEAIDKKAIKVKHETMLNTIISSVCLETNATCNKVSDVIYFKLENGKTMYSLEFLFGSMTLSVSNQLNIDKQKAISDFTSLALKTSSDLNTVYRLHRLMLENRGDRLRAFLFGWTA